MLVRLWQLIVSAAALLTSHILVTLEGLYERELTSLFSIDKAFHFTWGAFFAFFWLWLIRHKRLQRQLHPPTRFLFVFSLIAVSAVLSYLWEVFEHFVVSVSEPLARVTALYSPTLADALADIFFGLMGGVVIAVIAVRRHKVVLP